MNLLRDNVKQLYKKFLIPAVGGALVVALYSFVDTIAVGQGVGPNGTAAIAVSIPLFSVTNFLGIMCGIGGSVLMSKARGEGNYEKGNVYFTASLLYAAVATVALALLCWFFQKQIYGFFGADEIIMPYIMDYGKWLILAFPGFVFASYLACFVRNDGAPNLVMLATVAGAVVNMAGDWFFVFPMHMGISGAGLATALGAMAGALVLSAHFLTKRCTLRLVPTQRWWQTVKMISCSGFGSGFLDIALIVSTYIMNTQIMRYAGSAALAVYGVIITIGSLYQHIYSGVGQAAQPIASANFGAQQPQRILQTYRYSVITVSVLGAVFTLLGVLFPVMTVRLFMKVTPEVLMIAPYMIRVYSLSYFALGFNTLLIFYLQSVMQARMSTVIAMLRGLLVSGVLLYALPLWFSAAGIWWAVVAAEWMVCGFAFFYVQRLHAGRRTAIAACRL